MTNLLLLWVALWLCSLGGYAVISGIALALFSIYRSYRTQSL